MALELTDKQADLLAEEIASRLGGIMESAGSYWEVDVLLDACEKIDPLRAAVRELTEGRTIADLVHDESAHPDPVTEYEAYKTLADAHRASAAALSPNAKGRALMLRCAGRWDRIALNAAIRNDLRVDHRPFEVVG